MPHPRSQKAISVGETIMVAAFYVSHWYKKKQLLSTISSKRPSVFPKLGVKCHIRIWASYFRDRNVQSSLQMTKAPSKLWQAQAYAEDMGRNIWFRIPVLYITSKGEFRAVTYAKTSFSLQKPHPQRKSWQSQLGRGLKKISTLPPVLRRIRGS